MLAMRSALVRVPNCEILHASSDCVRTVRCRMCSKFRDHLRVKRSRHSHADPSLIVADNSHTAYSHLNKTELVDRLRNVQRSRKSIRAKYAHLLKKVIRREGVKICQEDEEDVQALLNEVAPTIEQDRDSPQYVLWQEQKKFNALKEKRQMRWHPLIIRFALSLFYSSRAAYRTAANSGFWHCLQSAHYETIHIGAVHIVAFSLSMYNKQRRSCLRKV